MGRSIAGCALDEAELLTGWVGIRTYRVSSKKKRNNRKETANAIAAIHPFQRQFRTPVEEMNDAAMVPRSVPTTALRL